MKNIIIIALVFLAFILTFWGGTKYNTKHNTSATVIDTVIDTVKVIRDTTLYSTDTIEVSVPYLVVDSFPYIMYAEFDTSEIIKDYYRMMAYKDTLVHDTNVTIIGSAVVYRNELLKHHAQYMIHRPTAIINQVTNNVSDVKKTGIYAGASLQGNRGYFDAFCMIGLSKDKNLYSVGYSPITKSIQVSYMRRF